MNISEDWKGSTNKERCVAKRLLELEGTPEAIKYFAEKRTDLSDYWYWFLLGTLWVSYSGHSDLNLWRELFGADRPNRETSLMKPDELREFRAFLERFGVFRAHRENETDWISYTCSFACVAKFAAMRENGSVKAYLVDKSDVIAYFTRRGEGEVLMLNKENAEFVKEIPTIYQGEACG